MVSLQTPWRPSGGFPSEHKVSKQRAWYAEAESAARNSCPVPAHHPLWKDEAMAIVTYVVEVFGTEEGGGNPAPIVVDASVMSDERMRGKVATTV